MKVAVIKCRRRCHVALGSTLLVSDQRKTVNYKTVGGLMTHKDLVSMTIMHRGERGNRATSEQRFCMPLKLM